MILTPVLDRDLDLMKRIDRLHLEMPYAGSRMLRDLLAQAGGNADEGHGH
jgi:putative transposase